MVDGRKIVSSSEAEAPGRAARGRCDEHETCHQRSPHTPSRHRGSRRYTLALAQTVQRRFAVSLTDQQQELSEASRWDLSDLRALYVNCTLKPSPEQSHTEGLMRLSMAIMESNGVA